LARRRPELHPARPPACPQPGSEHEAGDGEGTT